MLQGKNNLISIENNFTFAVEYAANLFFENKIFIYPTDTIYGIGGNPFNSTIHERISEIKERPPEQKFIFLINDVENLTQYIEVYQERHLDFLKKIWPAQVSVILKLNDEIKNQIGYSNAAFRIPNHKFCRSLLSKIRKPLISTSVNKSGKEALNDPQMISYEFGDVVDAIFYLNQSYSSASTIIDLTKEKPVLVREGAVKFETILRNL